MVYFPVESQAKWLVEDVAALPARLVERLEIEAERQGRRGAP
jgi:hypothetical protein